MSHPTTMREYYRYYPHIVSAGRRTLPPLVVALVGAGLVAAAGAAIALNGLLTGDGPTIALGLADLAVAAYLGAVVARLARD
jgi:hypothetical protein